MVVLVNEDHRQLPQGSQIHRLVECALIAAAVTEEGNATNSGSYMEQYIRLFVRYIQSLGLLIPGVSEQSVAAALHAQESEFVPLWFNTKGSNHPAAPVWTEPLVCLLSQGVSLTAPAKNVKS